MRQVIYMQSGTPGVLMVNGSFCGPLEDEGQAFPAGRNAEIYVQLFPFSAEFLPLCVRMELEEGRLVRLEPGDAAYALLWPDGIIQLELRPRRLSGVDAGEAAGQAENVVPGALLRYLSMRLAGERQADALLMRPQAAVDLTGYEAALPLRFAPLKAPSRFDDRAGLMRRLAPNVAQVDAALAVTVPAGQGRRLIEQIEIWRET